jgi:hypothetical protein
MQHDGAVGASRESCCVMSASRGMDQLGQQLCGSHAVWHSRRRHATHQAVSGGKAPRCMSVSEALCASRPPDAAPWGTHPSWRLSTTLRLQLTESDSCCLVGEWAS